MIKELIFKLVDSRYLTKVYHRECGGHVGYVADTNKAKKDTDNFYFLDGSHPKGCENVCVPCAKCGKDIKYMGDVVLLTIDTSIKS